VPTQTQRRETTHAAVIDAALAAFTRAGHLDVSLERIAHGAGVAKATLLYHFGTRQGLLRAVAVEVIGRLEATLADRGDSDVETWLRAVLEEQLTSNGRLLYAIGDELARRGELGEGDPMGYLVNRLRRFGVADAEVTAAATLQFGRQLAFGAVGVEEVDRLLSLLARARRLTE
jgi:AcrR family transcriptional regulator